MDTKETNPFHIFKSWYSEAVQSLDYEQAVAAALSTASKDGILDCRMVLVKEWSENGFIFYTNYHSPKSQQLESNPHAALCFYWHTLQKQIRIRGIVSKVDEKTSDEYFAKRDRISQIGAWASKQSQELPNSFELKKRVAYYFTQFGFSTIPRPPFWGGFILAPLEIEFWIKKPYRLHERLLFKRKDISDTNWEKKLLYP